LTRRAFMGFIQKITSDDFVLDVAMVTFFFTIDCLDRILSGLI